jgi:hypothetical protein
VARLIFFGKDGKPAAVEQKEKASGFLGDPEISDRF